MGESVNDLQKRLSDLNSRGLNLVQLLNQPLFESSHTASPNNLQVLTRFQSSQDVQQSLGSQFLKSKMSSLVTAGGGLIAAAVIPAVFAVASAATAIVVAGAVALPVVLTAGLVGSILHETKKFREDVGRKFEENTNALNRFANDSVELLGQSKSSIDISILDERTKLEGTVGMVADTLDKESGSSIGLAKDSKSRPTDHIIRALQSALQETTRTGGIDPASSTGLGIARNNPDREVGR